MPTSRPRLTTAPLLLAALLTPALLVPSAAQKAAPVTLSVQGPDTVVIGVPGRLSVTRRAGNLTLSGGSGVAWSSSAPEVVAVDAQGQLTARRLSAQPVVITATSGGAIASRAVTTLGLELTLGTFNFSAGARSARTGIAALAKLRVPAGVVLAPGSLALEVTGPAGRLPIPLDPLSPDNSVRPQERAGWVATPSRAALPGSYQATLKVGGATYRAEATLSAEAATRTLPPLSTLALSVQRNGTFTLSGLSGQTGQVVQVALFGPKAAQTYLGEFLSAASLPATGSFDRLPLAGRYTQGVYTFSAPPTVTPGSVTPARFDAAWTDLGEVVLP